MKIVPVNSKPLFCNIRVWNDSHAQDPHPVRWTSPQHVHCINNSQKNSLTV